MEEYDDLENGPNQDGSINLSYNEWAEMPEELYDKYRDRLLILNLSHNRILAVRSHVGKLILLKELNLSNNALESIDAGIGKCIRLRKLDLSHNRLRWIPQEISSCGLLEALLLQNNNISSIPEAISNLQALETLDLRNNPSLYYVPPKLASIPCLKVISCDGDTGLQALIPKNMLTQSNLVLWVLEKHYYYQDKVETVKQACNSIQNLVVNLELERISLDHQTDRLNNEIQKMKLDHPSQYIRLKSNLLIFFHEKRTKLNDWMRRAWAKIGIHNV